MRRARQDQLSFVFADRPQGGGDADGEERSDPRAWLRQRAQDRRVPPLAAKGADMGRLLEEVASVPNLARALLKVAQNRGAAGVDGRSIGEVVDASRRLLPALCRSLLEGSYRPADVRRVWIPKPGGGQRGLGIPTVVDRWVQQAVLQVLEPVFEPTFHDSSHGFRKGRGVESALTEAKGHLAQGSVWAVDLDIEKFFDRVHHQRLLDRLGRRVADRRLVRLIHRMLQAGVVLPDGLRVIPREGTPQGGPLSPLLANIVLDELDQELARRGHRFVRYADDCLIFVGSSRAGRRVTASVARFLAGRLRLAVNERKSTVSKVGFIHFLGFRLASTRHGGIAVHLSRRSKERLARRVRELTPRTWGQSLDGCLDRASQVLRGLMGHYRLCTREGARVFGQVDAHVRRRMRAIILRQKKRPRHLYRFLIRHGLSRKAAAATAFSRRGYWARSKAPGLERVFGNAWFHERLLSLAAEWKRLNPPALVSGQTCLFDLAAIDPKSRM